MSEEKTCPIHNVKLWWHDGQDGKEGWYSHKTNDPKYPKGYCNGKEIKEKKPIVTGPNMYEIRLEIAKLCVVPDMGIDWNQVVKVQDYVQGGIIPQTKDPFPPEAV